VLIELTKQIKLVRPEAKAVFPYSNSLYIDDDVKTLIDAGSGGRAYREIPQDEIRLLLLTHHHFDHINGWRFFSNAKIMAGREERWAFQDETGYAEATSSKRWLELMGTPREAIMETMSFPDDIPSRPGFQKLDIAAFFKDGDIFDLGKTSFTAVHTPGHSPGHYAFFFPRESILFSADLDLSLRGPWYGDENANLDDLIESINKLIALNPHTLLSSHRRIFTSGIEEAFHAYLDILLQREAKILDYLSEPRTIDDIASQEIISGWDHRIQQVLYWYKVMIQKHLDRLQQQGRVVKTENNKYLRS
jgi:endoribonuclease LACTB2